MHVCMIDENSHCSQTTTEAAARTICFLSENVHPSKVFNFHRNCFQLQFARTSPSTFLFLLSSQCQRADQVTVAGKIVTEASAPKFQTERRTLSGRPAVNRFCQKTPEQWEHKARRRPVRRVVVKAPKPVNTLFPFFSPV